MIIPGVPEASRQSGTLIGGVPVNPVSAKMANSSFCTPLTISANLLFSWMLLLDIVSLQRGHLGCLLDDITVEIHSLQKAWLHCEE
jgi:hypothetical protein